MAWYMTLLPSSSYYTLYIFISILTNLMLWDTYSPLPQRHPRWKEEPAFISTPATTVLTRLLPDVTTLRLEV